MIYQYKNAQILLNGTGIHAINATLDVASSNDPVYLAENKDRLGYAPSNGVGGSLRLSYYLSYRDFLKNYIEADSYSISGHFGGLYFTGGYLRSYAFNAVPNTPVVINSELVFFDDIKGSFNPTYIQSQNTGFFNISNATIQNASTKVGETITNILSADYNYNADIQPLYRAGEIMPDRIVFGQKETNIDVSTDKLDGDISIYGKNSIIELRFSYPFNTGIYENYKCQGILHQRNISTSVGQVIQSNFSIKSKTVDNPPVIFVFDPPRGGINDFVNIYGSNFSNTNSLIFNDASTINFTILSDTQISGIVPSGAVTGPITVVTNTSSRTTSENYTVTGQSMTITGLTPLTGLIGQTIELKGTNFYNINNVVFTDNKPSSFVRISSTLIRTNVPNYTSWGPIRIDSTTMDSVTSNPYFVPIPVIDSFTPMTGVSGTLITISGRGLSGISGVLFNNLPVTSVTNVNTEVITTNSPTGNTNGYIRILGRSGVSARSDVEFGPIVLLTGVIPNSGIKGSGVFLYGLNFEPSLMYQTGLSNQYLVGFNNTQTAFTRTNYYRLTGVVPSGATSGIVSIYKPDGISTYPSNVIFRINYAPPLVFAFSPLSGIRNNIIHLSGENFVDILTSGVKLVNSQYTQGGTGISASQDGKSLSFYVGNTTTGGLYSIVVNTIYGSGSGMFLKVLEIPQISGFTPLSGINGTQIKITGTNLYPFSKIYIQSTGVQVSINPTGHDSVFSQLYFNIPQDMPISGRIMIDNTVSMVSGAFLTKIVSPIQRLLIPSSGSWGAPINISGSGFFGVTGVYIGNILSSFTQTSGTGIRFTIPNGSESDYVNLYTFGNNYFPSTNLLTVIPPPIIISGFNPTSGFRNDSITISGAYLDTSTDVLFSGTNGMISQNSFSITSNTGIYVQIPLGAISGKIAITNSAGTTYSTQTLNVLLGPTITLPIYPYGRYQDSVDILGEGFTDAIFKFQGHSGQLITALTTQIVDNTYAVITVPREIIRAPIYVFNYGRSGTSPTNFIPIPTISGVNKLNVITGQSLTLTGINASEISTFVGISGASTYSSLLKTFNNNIFNITGAHVSNFTTGYSIITGLVDSLFLGTGRPYLIPSGYGIDDYFDLFNQIISGGNDIDHTTFSRSLGTYLGVKRNAPIC